MLIPEMSFGIVSRFRMDSVMDSEPRWESVQVSCMPEVRWSEGLVGHKYKLVGDSHIVEEYAMVQESLNIKLIRISIR